jgi:hypothetical protein
VLGVLWLAAPALTKTQAEEDMQLTGVSTPEAENLDREADKLLDQAQNLEARATALLAEGRKNIDQQAMMEALQRGDTSVLFQTTPEHKQALGLQAQAKALKDQAEANVVEAADKRAHAAVEQRCKAPSSAQNVAADPVASPFLCGAVRGAAKSEKNNPWEVCACAVQYARGLSEEIATIRARADALVGKPHFGQTVLAEWIQTEFYRPTIPGGHAPADWAGQIIKKFEEDAMQVQRDLARARVREKLSGRGYVREFHDTFNLAVRDAYALLLGVELAVDLYRKEVQLAAEVLTSEIGLHQGPPQESYAAQHTASYDRHYDLTSGRFDDAGFSADMQPIAKQHDHADYAYIEKIVPRARKIVDTIKDAERRLRHDFRHWANFAARDGVDLRSSFGDPFAESAERKLRWDIPPSRTLKDFGIWADFPQDFQQKYPELSRDNTHWTSSGSVYVATLTYSLDADEKEIVQAVASGAGASQRP